MEQLNEIRFLQLSQSIFVIENIEQTLMFLALLLCELFYIVFVNYAFQGVLNSLDGIYATICNTKWYRAPLSVQKLLLLILLNSISSRVVKFTVLICLVFLTRKFMLKHVSSVLMSLGCFARYNINWYQLPATKKLMDKIKRDVDMGQGEALEIMKKHAYMAKIYGLRFGCERL
ncbi:hypothetical protein WN51_05509 [Melipona quadrifasciata]|uniref:Uncharacterized protein n=1 Tax=Melipona quadrifasciata TaxID=166423 RepID=A0A0N0BKI6_9HYME|nr:hypothetical protein WN51_05509 [Melipona quadrifasciata]